MWKVLICAILESRDYACMNIYRLLTQWQNHSCFCVKSQWPVTKIEGVQKEIIQNYSKDMTAILSPIKDDKLMQVDGMIFRIM